MGRLNLFILLSYLFILFPESILMQEYAGKEESFIDWPHYPCVRPIPWVFEKKTYFQYSRADKDDREVYIYNMTEEKENFMRDWFDTARFPKLELTDKQWAWWLGLGSQRVRGYDKPEQESYPSDGTGERRQKRQLFTPIIPLCTRKEYRQMTSAERNDLHNGYLALKSSLVDGVSEYNLFVMWHRSVEAPGAHQGPNFLTWHRHFLWLFERAMRNHVPNACLAYWDSTLDQYLPDPSDAQIWTDSFLGGNAGTVSPPPFGAPSWDIIPDCLFLGNPLYRNTATGAAGQSMLYNDADINWVMSPSQTGFAKISCPNSGGDTSCKFEWDHGSVHVFVGGHMGHPTCSPSDPVFFMHHAFVDCTWERFRKKPSYPGPYPPHFDYDYSVPWLTNHQWDDEMKPFPGIINIQGLSNHYTDYYYRCAKPPQTCNPNVPLNPCDSNSPNLLWCDSDCKCKAKVRLGGDCTGLPHRACAGPCSGFMYQPRCVANVCGCHSIVIPATGLPERIRPPVA